MQNLIQPFTDLQPGRPTSDPLATHSRYIRDSFLYRFYYNKLRRITQKKNAELLRRFPMAQTVRTNPITD